MCWFRKKEVVECSEADKSLRLLMEYGKPAAWSSCSNADGKTRVLIISLFMRLYALTIDENRHPVRIDAVKRITLKANGSCTVNALSFESVSALFAWNWEPPSKEAMDEFACWVDTNTKDCPHDRIILRGEMDVHIFTE